MKNATTNQANNAVSIAILASDYVSVNAAVTYGINQIEKAEDVTFNKYLRAYIVRQVTQ